MRILKLTKEMIYMMLLIFCRFAKCEDSCSGPESVYFHFEGISPVVGFCDDGNDYCDLNSVSVNGSYVLSRDSNYNPNEFIVYTYTDNYSPISERITYPNGQQSYTSAYGLYIRLEYVRATYELTLSISTYNPHFSAGYFYGHVYDAGGALVSLNEINECYCARQGNGWKGYWSAGNGGSAWATWVGCLCEDCPILNFINFQDYAIFTQQERSLEEIADFCQLWLLGGLLSREWDR